MDFCRNFVGYVAVEVTSADPNGLLNIIQSADFLITNVESVDALTLRFQIKQRNLRELSKLCDKRGDRVQLLSKGGLFWSLAGLRKRPVLIVGITLLLIFALWVPGRVFFIQVEGNTRIASRQIVETAARYGITFGASRRQVRSEKMKNALLQAMPDLSWAGVNTYGCTAVISVRERDDSTPEYDVNRVCSIIALRDGIIREMTVLRGNGVCTVGQAVKAGQVLISAYTDCGLSIQAVAAKGEVFAETSRDLTAVCPSIVTLRGEETSVNRKISLIIGKKRIIFSNSSGISGSSCAKIYEENYVTLPGGFVLPLAIGVETWIYYETDDAALSDAEQVLTDFAQHYLSEQIYSGRILHSDEVFSELNGIWQLAGSYSCYEMIGITRIEENILNYVEND